MKPFSPFKPLIAAMFMLAAASAGAQATVTAAGLTTFSQSFAISTDQMLTNWTFFGSQTDDVTDASFFVQDSTGALLGLNTVSFSGTGWTLDEISVDLVAGSYSAFIVFDSIPGSVTLNTNSLGVGANLDTDMVNPPSVTGSYQFATNLNVVTAVPEPESYAMLLAGLGLMGAIARRRSRKA